ncbi:hypothetical protein GH714_000055 [Hevea brasiliensis]|uniref:Protein kinase domain-containing protein n=1 Tax=Hevea brasiliensis TaxID=3981 RepID=A0A6A6NAG2_HEVBR|nr:hypothetical protein GH714_000055 [Hevea brasiliensis]
MNLLALFLPIWALPSTFLFFLLDARPESTLSPISGPSLLARKEPISLFSAKMELNLQAVSQQMVEGLLLLVDSVGPPVAPMVKIVHHQDLNKRILIALIVASSVLGGILMFLSCFWIHRMKSSKNSNSKGKQNFDAGNGHSLSPILDKFNSLKMASRKGSIAVMEYQLLEAATNNFQENNLLGEGGHGRVYKAHVNDKLVAAVKKLEGTGQDVQREFENEMKWLTKIQHQNIISLLGYCIHGEAKFLVYEIMQNGSLESQLHGPTHGSALTWPLRMKIAVNVARQVQCLFVAFAMPQLTDRSKLPHIVDPVIKDTMDLKHLYQVAAVAVLCVQQEPSYRPLITDVLHSLIPLVPLELGGSLKVTEPLPPALHSQQ